MLRVIIIDFFHERYAFSSSNLEELIELLDWELEVLDDENGAWIASWVFAVRVLIDKLKSELDRSLSCSDDDIVDVADNWIGSVLMIESSPESDVIEQADGFISDSL